MQPFLEHFLKLIFFRFQVRENVGRHVFSFIFIKNKKKCKLLDLFKEKIIHSMKFDRISKLNVFLTMNHK